MTTGSASECSVRIVIVNWNAAWLTARCLASIERLDRSRTGPNLDVVVVDNASQDRSVALLTAAFPHVSVIANDRNVGFAAACNQAMLPAAGHAYVLLLNNDAVIAPDALARLVDHLDAHPGVGAAVPTMLLEPDYVEVDHVPAGVELTRVEVDGVDVTHTCITHGAHIDLSPSPPHRGVITTTDHTSLWVPIQPGSPAPTEVRLDVRDGTDRRSVSVSVRTGSPCRLINSQGADRTGWGEGIDRSFGQTWTAEPGQPGEVTGFSGGAVLLRTEMLAEIGGFAPVFFAYYEDTDLSWRTRRRGWRIDLVPHAVVEHRHGATAGPSSPRFLFLNHRNWLLTVLRNGSPSEMARAGMVALRRTVRTVRAGRRMLAPSPSRWALAWSWCQVWTAVVAGAPAALAVRAGQRAPDIGRIRVPRNGSDRPTELPHPRRLPGDSEPIVMVAADVDAAMRAVTPEQRGVVARSLLGLGEPGTPPTGPEVIIR